MKVEGATFSKEELLEYLRRKCLKVVVYEEDLSPLIVDARGLEDPGCAGFSVLANGMLVEWSKEKSAYIVRVYESTLPECMVHRILSPKARVKDLLGGEGGRY